MISYLSEVELIQDLPFAISKFSIYFIGPAHLLLMTYIDNNNISFLDDQLLNKTGV